VTPRAACRERDDLDWFPHGGNTSHAVLDVRASCLMRAECAAAGLGEDYGVWGGMTVAGRRRLLACASAA
jgi:Transcription factor WhiB